MPRRSRTSRAYQAVAVPQSQVTIASSGSARESSHSTRCGFKGSVSCIARASATFHQSRTQPSTRRRHEGSSRGASRGSSARNVAALSPIRFTSVG